MVFPNEDRCAAESLNCALDTTALDNPAFDNPALDNLGDVVAALARAYGELDAAALVELFADDSEWLDTVGRRVRGRDQLRAHLERMFESGWIPGGTLSGQAAITVRTIDPNTALAWISTAIPQAQLQTPEQRLHRLQVLRHAGGRWLVVAEFVVDGTSRSRASPGCDRIEIEE